MPSHVFPPWVERRRRAPGGGGIASRHLSGSRDRGPCLENSPPGRWAARAPAERRRPSPPRPCPPVCPGARTRRLRLVTWPGLVPADHVPCPSRGRARAEPGTDSGPHPLGPRTPPRQPPGLHGPAFYLSPAPQPGQPQRKHDLGVGRGRRDPGRNLCRSPHLHSLLG